ncbi:GUN4 domain-containing protein [Calothrix sp. PCC 7507]|uniref:GUN4 domain-containing protein n=1 Tax=Calothrix sp. PCC 7507 TaxID=99598 RepID=UPI0035104EF9
MPTARIPLTRIIISFASSEADTETMAIMLKITHREKQGWLDVQDIKKIPIEDLQTINQLWEKHSGGYFGFRVQMHIWLSVAGTSQADYETWCLFGDRVGWYQDNFWKEYHNLTFSSNTRLGHLPCRVFMTYQGFGDWILRLSSVAERFVNSK